MEILFLILAFLFGIAVGIVLSYLVVRYLAPRLMERYMQKQTAKMLNLAGSVGPTPLDVNAMMDLVSQMMQPKVNKDR